jgi:hypothetical protein
MALTALIYASAEASRMSVEEATEGPVVALDFQLERDHDLRVLAGGDAADCELAEIGRDPRDPLDRLEDRVEGAVANSDVADQDPIGAADRDGGHRDYARAGGCDRRLMWPLLADVVRLPRPARNRHGCHQ